MYFIAYTALAVALSGLLSACGDGSSDTGSGGASSQIQVNAFIAGAQDGARVASFNDERVVIAWTSAGQDGDLGGVFARLFSSDLQPDGEEFQVNVATAGSQSLETVAPLAGGGFLIAWRDGASALARRFDESGSPASEPLEIEGGLGEAFGSDGQGRFVVAEDNACTGDYGVYSCTTARRTSANGTSAGDPFFEAPLTFDLDFEPMGQLLPDVAASSNGEFVVVWSASGAHHENYYYDIWGQAFDANLARRGGTSFIGSTGPQGSQASAAMGATGNFVVVWDTCVPQYDDFGYGGGDCYYAGISGLRSTSVGDRQHFTVTDQKTYYEPDYLDRVNSVSINGSDEFIVVWERSASDGSDLMAQRFDDQANALGTRFVVNEETAGAQCCAQSVMLADGSVVVVWESDDGDGRGIFARRIPSDAP